MAELARKLLNLRPGEGSRVALLCLFIFASHACQAMGKVLQLSVFLDVYGRGAIPYAFLFSAAAVAVFSLLFASLARSVSRRRLVPATLSLLVAGFLVWRLGLYDRVPHDAFVLYIWVEVATILAVVLAWNYVNDACDPREGKRILPLAALGASAAFLINGFGVHPLVKGGLPAQDLAYFIVGILVLGIVLFYILEARYSQPEGKGACKEKRRAGATREVQRSARARAKEVGESVVARESVVAGGTGAGTGAREGAGTGAGTGEDRGERSVEGSGSGDGSGRGDGNGSGSGRARVQGALGRWGRSLRGGFVQISKSDLLRLFAVVTVLAILTQQLLDYMFMSALRDRFEKAELAVFIGTFMGALGGAQILLQLVVTGRLLNRLGGAVCVTLEPLAVAVTSLFFILFPGFWILMGLRFFDRVLKTSFYSPSLQTLYTPVPRGQKIQAMALIKGFVSPLAKVVGAVALLFFWKGMGLKWLAVGVAGLSALSAIYLLAKAKPAYLKALHRALDRRKLTLDGGLDDDVTLAVDGTVLKMVRGAVEGDDPGNAVFALRFLEGAPLSQARPVIIRALKSPHSAVRREALTLLEGGGPAEGEVIVERGLGDTDGDVVLAALGALARLQQRSARKRVEALLTDERPNVAAGAGVWVKRLFPSDPGEAGKVLSNLLALQDAETRRGVAQALQEVGDESFVAEAKVLLLDPHETVRADALAAAGALHMDELVDDVFLCFESRGPRDMAAQALSGLGDAAVERLRRFVNGQRVDEGALRRVPWILSNLDGAAPRELLQELLGHEVHDVRLRAARILARGGVSGLDRRRLRELWEDELAQGYRLLALEAALAGPAGLSGPADTSAGTLMAVGPGSGLLLGQIRHRKKQVRRRLLALVGLDVGLGTADLILANLESGQKRLEASAVELLENLTPPPISEKLIPMIEEVTVSSRVARLPEELDALYGRWFSDPFGTLASCDDLYLKAFLVYEKGETLGEVQRKRLEEEVQAVLPLIEKILFLKSAPIFAGLSGEELHRIAEIADEVSFDKGEVVFRQDDPGDAMYLILHGAVSIRVKGREVVRLGSKECFGEMALLDNLPRSADVLVAKDADLLRIDADSFDELLEQKHAIVKGIFKVLTGRIREANVKGKQESIGSS